jgi:hypothetical protein
MSAANNGALIVNNNLKQNDLYHFPINIISIPIHKIYFVYLWIVHLTKTRLLLKILAIKIIGENFN